MDYHSFINEVKSRAHLNTKEEAVEAAHATLTSLGERLMEGEKTDLAAQLPRELAQFLDEAESGQKLNIDEFLNRISEREHTKFADATFHAQVVFEVLHEAVSPGKCAM